MATGQVVRYDVFVIFQACLNVGETTDQTLLEAMNNRLKSNGHYSSRALSNGKANGRYDH